MDDVLLTAFIIGNNEIKLSNIPKKVEVVKYKGVLDLFDAKGKYLVFIDSEDKISKNYFKCILDKIKQSEFDSCFINYHINYDYERELKIRKVESEYNAIFPIKNSYIWSYVFRKETFLKIYIFADREDYNEIIVDLFRVRTSIPEIIYFHNKDGEFINIFNMVNRKKPIYYKNIIYMGTFCDCLFNGYITWILEIGKAFKDYPITFMYTKLNEKTKKRFEEYFDCVWFDPSCDYVCDNLITSFATYYYPINFHSLKQCCIFIHGVMADHAQSGISTEKIYDRYIAVSEVASKGAIGYMPTDNIEVINNPFTFDKNNIKPHFSLISAIRNSPEKGIDRIKKAAMILDNEGIPYTWTVFIDVLEPNQGGLIFRHSVPNIIDYISDCDYLVQFSASESLSYSMTEALCAGTKVFTTDIPAIHELGVIDGVNGFTLPLEYFDDGKETLLKGKLLLAYKKKDLKFEYTYGSDRFADYDNVFSK